jgi:hypothetical protein
MAPFKVGILLEIPPGEVLEPQILTFFLMTGHEKGTQ